MSTEVVYWDASAVLSALMEDGSSRTAHACAGSSGVHLVSSLTLAEVHAVISRLRRENLLPDLLARAALESLETGPWRRLRLVPEEDDIRQLAARHALRGADLWHLAAVKTLAGELPEVRLLTFDHRLAAAVAAEGLSSP